MKDVGQDVGVKEEGPDREEWEDEEPVVANGVARCEVGGAADTGGEGEDGEEVEDEVGWGVEEVVSEADDGGFEAAGGEGLDDEVEFALGEPTVVDGIFLDVAAREAENGG